MREPISAVALIAALAGCTGSTDPYEAGLLDNIRNLGTGEYGRQVQDLDRQTASAAAEIESNQAALDAERQAQSANAAELSRLRQQIASVQSDIDKALAKISAEDTRRPELVKLKGNAAQIHQAVASGSPPSNASAQIDSIRASLRALSL